MADHEPFAAAGLLDGLEGAARDERADLLRWLRDDYKLTEAAMRQSTANGTIVLAAAGRRLGTGERYSARDVAHASGIPVALWMDLVRASGLSAPIDADQVFYGTAHLETAQTIGQFLAAGVQPGQLINVSRVLGHGFAQAADLMRQTVMELAIEPGVTETKLAAAYAATSEGLTPLLGPLMDQMLRLHLHNAVRDEVVTHAERQAGELPGARTVAVAFADLVGFTKLGEELPPEQLEQVAERLVTLTADVVSAPVRLVKSVGDAVLLISPEPLELARTAFAILEQIELQERQGRDFPQVRIGLAMGPAVARAGDWFGRPVNLASRITGVARAGSVVTDMAIRDAIGEAPGITWSSVGERRLKNVNGAVRLFRARPSGS